MGSFTTTSSPICELPGHRLQNPPVVLEQSPIRPELLAQALKHLSFKHKLQGQHSFLTCHLRASARRCPPQDPGPLTLAPPILMFALITNNIRSLWESSI